MNTYYIRHTKGLDINDATRQGLWDERRIAIHFPNNKTGKLGKRDNASLDLADYPKDGQKPMRALAELAKNGGYVCAEYFQHSECILGYIRPDSKIELIRGTWGSKYGYDGREAILKSLQLERVKLVNPSDLAVIFSARPRQGTIMRWRRAGNTVENAVEGRRAKFSLSLLSHDQQEIMCSEFLRSSSAVGLGLPKLAHLLLPVGRTMKDIDIWGITESGKMLFVQVTYLRLEDCDAKLQALLKYRGPDQNKLLLFCDSPEVSDKDGVKIVPLQRCYDAFVATPTGKVWIERATGIMSLPRE
jgi:hypothetical protein